MYRRSSARSSTRRRFGKTFGNRAGESRYRRCRFDRLTARYLPDAGGDRPYERDVLRSDNAWNMHADDDAKESDQPQHRDHPDKREQRQRPALPRGLGRTEKGIRENDERQGVERGSEPVVQFRAIFASLRDVSRILGRRPHQLPDIFFTHIVDDDALWAGGEFR